MTFQSIRPPPLRTKQEILAYLSAVLDWSLNLSEI
jgi:hypothetical protein